MTKGLEEALGLMPLAEALALNNINIDEKPDPAFTGVDLAGPADLISDAPITGSMDVQVALDAVGEGSDHGAAMDTVFDETLRLARDTAEMAYQADMARQPRFLEVASALFKTAIDAKNSKRDNQLKTIKLALDYRRMELEARGAGNHSAAVQTGAVFHTDRNEVIAQAIAERKKLVKADADKAGIEDKPKS